MQAVFPLGVLIQRSGNIGKTYEAKRGQHDSAKKNSRDGRLMIFIA